MEQIIEEKQLMTQQQAQSIQRWQQEEVLLLARHFQRLNVGKSPFSGHFTRTNCFVMKPDDVHTLNTLKNISRIRIYMSLEEEDKERFTFCPIINIKFGTDNQRWFTLEPIYQQPEKPILPDTDVNTGGTIVPGIFKEMILANWMSIEDNLIDDLFVAKIVTSSTLVRVNFFEVNSATILELFNTTLHNNISEFVVYPGIDMNKFQDRNMISFTPVIGVTPKNEVATEIISRHGLAEFTIDQIFMEYLTPCPPTCT
ncbi:hypothetical protein [Aquimarina sp. RZ0]|uniref:hypothetical protein n=1 Tax=Aquimarina sp. RZ0 TaxID=2607730 RepID=UPI0011F21E4C|nr:hypothetical protein [Aquimarina sp. RZ0]KAA1247311.1 hypothetical protein F0000_03965 [Aquimarina sp. RZ0]